MYGYILSNVSSVLHIVGVRNVWRAILILRTLFYHGGRDNQERLCQGLSTPLEHNMSSFNIQHNLYGLERRNKYLQPIWFKDE